jgi:hypothetical protein
MNFGEDRMDSNVIQIGGMSLHGIGFQVCGSCGKIQSKLVKAERRHDISCKNYGKDMEGQSFENTFLLYRELKSEAIRLLIPSLNQDEGRDTQSFVAAIHLGLKSVFGGHLNHLKLSVQQLPISGSNMRSQHVFIYDSVPGGTGYPMRVLHVPVTPINPNPGFSGDGSLSFNSSHAEVLNFGWQVSVERKSSGISKVMDCRNDLRNSDFRCSRLSRRIFSCSVAALSKQASQICGLKNLIHSAV